MLGYSKIGNGAQVVVILNDWLGDTSTWDGARPYLDGDAFTWALTDVRGYGRSRGLRGDYSVEEIASDVVELADAQGWSQFTIVGHSMSCLAALHLAQTRPERITRAVTITPPPTTAFGYDEGTYAAVRAVALGDDAGRTRFVKAILGDRLSPGWLRFKVDQWRAAADPEAVAGYLAMFALRGLPEPTRRIGCPLFAITAQRDAEPMRLDAATRFLAPLSDRFVAEEIPECGHYPMQETPPFLVARLEHFLRSSAA
jgi:pimeloyl-ACP methyl ester carboxylesterase